MGESGEPGSLYAAVGTETKLSSQGSQEVSAVIVKPRRRKGAEGRRNYYHRPRLGKGQRRRPSFIRNYTCVIGCFGLPEPCLECVAHRARRAEARKRRRKKVEVRAAAEGLVGLAPENPGGMEVCGVGNDGGSSGSGIKAGGSPSSPNVAGEEGKSIKPSLSCSHHTTMGNEEETSPLPTVIPFNYFHTDRMTPAARLVHYDQHGVTSPSEQQAHYKTANALLQSARHHTVEHLTQTILERCGCQKGHYGHAASTKDIASSFVNDATGAHDDELYSILYSTMTSEKPRVGRLVMKDMNIKITTPGLTTMDDGTSKNGSTTEARTTWLNRVISATLPVLRRKITAPGTRAHGRHFTDRRANRQRENPRTPLPKLMRRQASAKRLHRTLQDASSMSKVSAEAQLILSPLGSSKIMTGHSINAPKVQ